MSNETKQAYYDWAVEVDNEPGIFYRSLRIVSGDRVICRFPTGISPQQKVNAALCAAAPEMLEALRGALKWLESDEHQAEGGADDTYMAALRERISIARQAIAKATGEA